MRMRFIAVAVTAALIGLTVAFTIGGASAGAAGSHQGVRWDIVDVSNGFAATVGGDVTIADPANGDTLTLTGSGRAEPSEKEASGGGTFTHTASNGTVFAQGVYIVRDFRYWDPTQGSFAATGLRDAIDDPSDAHAGVLKMRVAFLVNGKVVGHGSITVTCALPGAPPNLEEGVTVKATTATGIHFDFSEITDPGPTLFHIID